MMENSPWYSKPRSGERSTMDEVRKRLVDIGERKTVCTIGQTGILWKLDRTIGRVYRRQGKPSF